MDRFSLEEILREALFAEPGSKNDAKNAVDALFSIADSLHEVAAALRALGNGNACTQMGAIEAFGIVVKDSADRLADAIETQR